MVRISQSRASKVSFLRLALSLLSAAISALLMAAASEKAAIAIRNVRSGAAILRQQQRLTILESKSGAGSVQRLALSHPSQYRQGSNAPYQAQMIVGGAPIAI
jgi:hypothetical protein